MLNLLRLAVALTASLFIPHISFASDFIGNPKYVSIVVERDTTRVRNTDRMTMNFCPVNAENSFKGSCWNDAYVHPGSKGVTYEIIKNDRYEYVIGWQRPKPRAVYAFANGSQGVAPAATILSSGNLLVGPATITETAVMEGGSVVVKARPETRSKKFQNASVARVKAIFKKHYGTDITKQMKFSHFAYTNVSCLYSSETRLFQWQIRKNKCVLR